MNRHPLRSARVGHVEDEPGVTAVLVILAAKQRGRFIQQRRLQGADPFGQAIHLLMQMRFPQMKNGARFKFMLFLPALDHELSAVLARAHLLRQRRYQLAHRAEH